MEKKVFSRKGARKTWHSYGRQGGERKKNIATEILIFTKRNAEWIMDHRPKCRTHKYKTSNIGSKI